MKTNLLAVAVACGLLPAQAAVFEYSVTLDGPSSGTPSLGTGSGSVIYDDALHTLQLSVAFSGLITTSGAGTTISHIHAATVNPFTGTAGVATPTPTFPGFPAGVTSGTYADTLDLTLSSSFNAAYIAANGGTVGSAEAALAAAMASGRAYWNIHTEAFAGGEIRGFLTPTVVPEPSSLALAGLGAIGLAAALRRRKRAS